MTKGAIFTFGYQGSTPANLLDLCRALSITHVVDCRRKPMSRIPGFGGNQLKALFETGIARGRTPGMPHYDQRGDVLGGTPQSMQTPDGSPPPVSLAALYEIRAEVFNGARLLLICQEHAPGDCHRHATIALPLARDGVEVLHVFDDELIEPLELQRALDAPDREAEYECEKLADYLERLEREAEDEPAAESP